VAVGGVTLPLVEIAVPVRDEAATLAANVGALVAWLERHAPSSRDVCVVPACQGQGRRDDPASRHGCVVPACQGQRRCGGFAWRIVVVENGSSDATAAIARSLAARDARIRVLELDAAGRGGALRAAWLASDADVVAYMDVDLSTNLDALGPLVAPLLDRSADVAIGTRLAAASRVRRCVRREVLSRGYNALARTVCGATFSDAQCGFKALRADVARALVPDVRDDGWFFDTELLLLAQRAGLTIAEVPAQWIEDLDSRVRIVPTVIADVRGLWRLRRAPRRRRRGTALLPRAPGPAAARRA
jgi:glycosyltransferase involved in cell wall biosynthesis